MEANRHFTAIVVGDNPEELMKKYDSLSKTEPYIVYEFRKVSKYKENIINGYTSLLKNKDLDEETRFFYTEEIEHIKDCDDIDFYTELTEGLDIDPENGNAVSNVNPNGKYTYCRIGKNLSMPLIDTDGNEVFQAKKCDIQWDKIHLAKKEVYDAAWEMIMGDKKPSNEEEKIIYENMKNRKDYFAFFGTKEKYIMSNTAFWGYAFVDQNGWKEMEDNVDEIGWISSFFDRFIKNLPNDTLITVFECFRQ